MSSLWIALARLSLALARGLRDPEFRSILFLLLLAVVGGTLFYRSAEGWSWVDAAYFSVTTLLTLGNNQLGPTSALSKIFTIAYALGGIGLMLAFVYRLGQMMVRRRPEDDDKAG